MIRNHYGKSLKQNFRFTRAGSTRQFRSHSPSGKAGVCKTLIMGSIPIVASFDAHICHLYHDFDLLRPIYGGHKKPVLRANSAHIALYGKSLCENQPNFI